MIQLTTNIFMGNGARLLLSIRPDEDIPAAYVTAELRMSVANGDVVLSTKTFVLRNGQCDMLRKRPLVPPGANVNETLEVVEGALALPSGYDNAVAAYYGAAKSGRKAALGQHGLTAGWIHSTLTGT